MEIREAPLTDEIARELIAMSGDWEAENSCYGYVKNGYDDIAGNRIFLAEEDGGTIGYLLGHKAKAKQTSSIMPEGTEFFEVEELYVKPAYRSQGVGSALFRYVESRVKPETSCLMLGTATKDFRSILHFYIDELGMEFWSARLFKKLSDN